MNNDLSEYNKLEVSDDKYISKMYKKRMVYYELGIIKKNEDKNSI